MIQLLTFRAFFCIKILPGFLHRRIVQPANQDSGNADVLLLDLEAISNILSGLVLFIAPSIIVVPMFVLYAIPSTWGRMAGLWLFSTIFAITIRLLTAGIDSGLTFAITAAYVVSRY